MCVLFVSNTCKFNAPCFPITVARVNLTLSKEPSRVGLPLPHLSTETDPVSETLCFPVFGILDDGQSPETQ
jgi:hypothetical protein